MGQVSEYTRLPDGRFNIVVQGLSRVRLIEELRSEAYRVARAEAAEDVQPPGSGVAESLRTELLKLLRRAAPHLLGPARDLESRVRAASDAAESADIVAGTLVEDPDERQALLEELDAVDNFDKVSAALFCQSQLNPELDAIPVVHFPLGDRDAFQKWLRRHEPEVVIGFNDTVHWWLQEAGRRVPEEVAFISVDTDGLLKNGGVMLSGMNPDYAFIGRTSVGQLAILLRTHQQGIPERPLTVHVPSIWIQGDTLTPKVQAPARKTKARRLVRAK